MDHVKKLEFPKGTPDRFVQEVASKISSWHIVSQIRTDGLTIEWTQSTYCGHGAEGLSAFVEGLMLGFNLTNKSRLTCIMTYDDGSTYTF